MPMLGDVNEKRDDLDVHMIPGRVKSRMEFERKIDSIIVFAGRSISDRKITVDKEQTLKEKL